MSFLLRGPSSRVDGAAPETIESIREHSQHQPPNWQDGVCAARSIENWNGSITSGIQMSSGPFIVR